MYETNAIGLDISHYDHTIDAEQLRGNVDFLIIKAGGSDGGTIYLDGRFAERVQMAHDIGVPAMAYWFTGPEYWLLGQYTMSKVEALSDDRHPILQMVMRQFSNKALYGVFFDIEDASVKMTNGGTVPQSWVSFYTRDLVQRIRRQQRLGNMRDFRLGTYSRRSFVENPENRQVDLEAYLGTQPDLAIWTANWVTGTGATLPMSEIRKLRPTHKPMVYGRCPERTKEWQFWQWSGDIGRVYKSPAVTNERGQARGLDIDLFNGTVAELYDWLGFKTGTPPVVVEPEQPPVTEPEQPDLAALAARVAAIEDWIKGFGQ